jgi:hypothetical protein
MGCSGVPANVAVLLQPIQHTEHPEQIIHHLNEINTAMQFQTNKKYGTNSMH